MDSFGKPLAIGKYYQLEHHHYTQYMGQDSTRRNYLFTWFYVPEFKKKRTIIKRTNAILEEFHPIPINDNDTTDDEMDDDPFEH